MGLGFDRVASPHGDAVAEALRLLPEPIEYRLRGVEFMIGYDPGYVGAYDYTRFGDVAGREMRSMPHTLYSFGRTDRPASDRPPVVILPEIDWQIRMLGAKDVVATIVHELGHVLDERLGFDRHDPLPVCGYAQTNRWEAFACAFELWVAPEHAMVRQRWDPGRFSYSPEVLAGDHETLALFEALAEGGRPPPMARFPLNRAAGGDVMRKDGR